MLHFMAVAATSGTTRVFPLLATAMAVSHCVLSILGVTHLLLVISWRVSFLQSKFATLVYLFTAITHSTDLCCRMV